MCNHGFTTSFTDATHETGMNGHEYDVQDVLPTHSGIDPGGEWGG